MIEKDIIAILCSYIPVEIIDAAGFTYERIFDNSDDISPKIRSIFPTYMCSYASSCLNKLCNDSNNYEAVIFTNSCHPMEGVYESLEKLQRDIRKFMLNVPRSQDDEAVDYFGMELKRLIDYFQENFCVSITSDDLKKSVKKFNNKRTVHNKLNELIQNKEIVLTAKETNSLNKCYLENECDYEKKVQAIIDSKEERNTDFTLPRIMLSGNICIPRDILEVIEEYKGNVVLCNNCDGYRSLTNCINEDGDVLQNISRAYLNKPACLHCKNIDLKLKQFEKYLDDYDINGVIFSVMKFCTDQTYWMVNVEKLLKEKGIPFLFIDSDYYSKSSGQVHTRIQAFLENL